MAIVPFLISTLISSVVYYAGAYNSLLWYLLPFTAIGYAYLMIRHGERYFYAALFWFGLVAYFLVPGMAAVLALVFIGINGYALGNLFKKEHRPSEGVFMMALSNILALLISGEAVKSLSTLDLTKMYNDYFNAAAAQIAKDFNQTNPAMVETFKSQVEVMQSLMPSMIILFGVLLGALVFVVSKRVLSLFNIRVTTPSKFAEFRYPRTIFPGILFILVVLYTASKLNMIDMNIATINFVFILINVFSIQGMASTIRFMARFKGGKTIAQVALFLLVITNGTVFLGVLGIISAIGDSLTPKGVN